jgi:hypothetical protein
MFHTQPLSQMDPRWKDVLLGFSGDLTIGKYGCLLTAMAMVANGFGAQKTPLVLNERMKSVKGFVGALIVPALLPLVAPGVRYLKRIECSSPPAPLAEIDSSLAAGLPVIVKVDSSPASGMQDHWVVVTHKDRDEYMILDPWPYPCPSQPVPLSQRYGFAGPPRQSIKDTLWYAGTGVPKATPAPRKLVPQGALALVSITDGLALRTQPLVVEHTLIKRMVLGSRLHCLEAASTAVQKIGQLNEWLEVEEESSGVQGFTAAWYVARSIPSQPSPEQPESEPVVLPIPSAEALVVFAAADELALRRQPVIATETLIKRVPVNTEFFVLENKEQAQHKIGSVGEWLHVRDIEGVLGYVAAWYVGLTRKEPALGVHEQSPATSPLAEPVPASLVLRTVEEGLALRRSPAILPDNLVKRQPLSAELLVIEDTDLAQAKIGTLNQWLHVRDIYGDEGYVAAWCVVKAPAPVYLEPVP